MLSTSLNTSNLNFQGFQTPSSTSKLNLVALMDIFTILVFFLLLNSGDADQLENARFVKLPDSTITAAPHVEATILISENEIWFNGEVVVNVDDVLNSPERIIAPLAEVLVEYATKRGALTSYEKSNGFSVTIVGDRSVSFSLLERVMATCSGENFRDISLAVNRVAAISLLNQTTSPSALSVDGKPDEG